MKRNEFLDSLCEANITNEIKIKIDNVYGEVPDIILKILSSFPKVELFDENESRTLSLLEILNAEDDYGVPFQSRKFVPIVELRDNDLIVYDGNEKKWALYNVADESVFNRRETFEELFLS